MKNLYIVLILLILAPFMEPGKATAADFQLAPFKDKLFNYPEILESSPDGSYRLVEYIKKRDIEARDKIPLRKVHRKYVHEGVRWSRRLRTYQSVNGTFKYYQVGQKKEARITVIYVHGKGGNHRQGVNDWTFGGNFNRLQNLMTRNKGVLLTPSFSDFGKKGAEDIAALVTEYKKRSPKGKLMVGCGSMGGAICWRLLNNPATASKLDGVFILGSHWDDDFLSSSVARGKTRPVPLYIGHGNDDVVFDYKTQLDFYKKIKNQNPSYPARFVMFDTGRHGTPIRMVDWRKELNWMLRQ